MTVPKVKKMVLHIFTSHFKTGKGLEGPKISCKLNSLIPTLKVHSPFPIHIHYMLTQKVYFLCKI